MEFVGWLLLTVADLLRWAGHGLLVAGTWLWETFDGLLNPILSPVLSGLNPICTALGDVAYGVFAGTSPWVSLLLFSALAGALTLVGFRYTSNQTAIGRARDEITANLLALKLYKDQLGATIRSQGRLFRAIVKLQFYMLFPMLLMLPPMMLLLGQIGVRHQWSPLAVGQSAVVRVVVPGDATVMPDVSLMPNDAVAVEVDGIPGGDEIVWRVRPNVVGRHRLAFMVDGEPIEKEIVVGEGIGRVSAERTSGRWLAQVLHPIEPTIPAAATITSIIVEYPLRPSRITGANYWLLSFFVVSMAVALALTPVFGVRF